MAHYYRVVVFFIWLAPAIGRDFSWAVVAVVALLFSASLAFLLATALLDPGFVPRDPPDDVEMGCAFLLPSRKQAFSAMQADQ